jgi:hypothetical protein
MPNIEIKNKSNYKGDGYYVGRPSALGNPFHMRGEWQRSNVIGRYKLWLERQIRVPKSRACCELMNLVNQYKCGKSITLICWCSPKPCHADIIKSKIIELAGDSGDLLKVGAKPIKPKPELRRGNEAS